MSMTGTPRDIVVSPLGDNALVARFAGDSADGAADPAVSCGLVRAIAAALRDANLPGITDVVPSPDRVTLVRDAMPGSDAAPRPTGAIDGLATEVTRIARHAAATASPRAGSPHAIEVRYGGEDGPDLESVCLALGIDPATFVRLHSQADYVVTAIGFVPGFPYLAGLPASLALPRRGTPRARVPAGSVGIGGRQTGIYPFATPGGWHIVGRTNARLFEPGRDLPALLQVGDRVRFIETTRVPDVRATGAAGPADQTSHRASSPAVGRKRVTHDHRPAAVPPPAMPTPGRRLTILSPGLHTTVQDLGRHGFRHAGVPGGGAADRVALRLANLAVGNPADAAGLECTLTGPEIRFDCDATIAVVGATFPDIPHGRPIHVEAGTVISLRHARSGCRGYLAVAGGIDVERVLGSRSTYVPAALGGVEGRALAPGDVMAIGRALTRTIGTDWSLAPSVLPAPRATTVLRVVPSAPPASGSAEAWEASYRTTARSDRMGVRLEGPPLPASGGGMSIAVLPGTVQVPPDGQPIILLADAQTIGGYDVLGQVIVADLALAAQLRPGDAVRFLPVEAAIAHDALRDRERTLALAGAALVSRTVSVTTIDLNADVGEGGRHDAAIMPLVTSVNIACGGHAGDDASMREAVALARRHGLAVGAHPGHADRGTFGRIERAIAPNEAADLVARQVAALEAIAGADLRHVKLHGALYHQVAHDPDLAAAVVARLADRFPGLSVVAPAASPLVDLATRLGLVVRREAFVDRAYAADGRLVPRSRSGATLTDPRAAAAQAVGIARDGRVRSIDGRDVHVRADTLCVHGDHLDPVGCLRAVRRGLVIAGIDVARA